MIGLFMRMKWVMAALLFVSTQAMAESHTQQIVIEGTISHEQHRTYVTREFEVPDGVLGLSISMDHDGRQDRTVIDIGLQDPEGFRGWTGSNKSRIELSAFDATPGYRNGPILAGTWALLLGIPNLREDVETRYKATINLYPNHNLANALIPAGRPIDTGPGWYRGDLHVHTGHSDGYCLSERGASVPCPVHVSVEAAVLANLDFLAITDHNTLSHHQSMRELQPYFDNILLLPGREITTFYGHANVFGASAPIDHRIGPTTDRTIDDLLGEVQEQGALMSINHPGLPSGETCMGCGWQLPTVNYGQVDAIEVINGGAGKFWRGAPESEKGIEFWHSILDQGQRVTAIGGSDNHDPKLSRDGRQVLIGTPTTVVFAQELSQAGLFAGIRSGRVYVEVSGQGDRTIQIRASSGQLKADMGGDLSVDRGQPVNLDIHVVGGAPGDVVELVTNQGRSLPLQDSQLDTSNETKTYAFVADGRYAWIRANVRDSEGRLLILSNPVYLNFNDPDSTR